MLTSGVGSVKSIISKGTKVIGEFFEIIFEFIEAIFKKRSAKLDKIQAVSEFFSSGTDDVLDAVRQLRIKLNRYFNGGALKHLDQDDFDSFTTQKQFIEDVESGKQNINPGNKSDGSPRKDNDQTLKGNYGECKMNQLILENSTRRYKPLVRLNDDPYKKFPTGIDGIFENLDYKPPPPAKYIIAEAKYSSDGTTGLSTEPTNDGLQMSRTWIEKRLFASISDTKKRDKILSTFRDSKGKKHRNYTSVLFKIDKTGKVSYFELTVEDIPQIIKKSKLKL